MMNYNLQHLIKNGQLFTMIWNPTIFIQNDLSPTYLYVTTS